MLNSVIKKKKKLKKMLKTKVGVPSYGTLGAARILLLPAHKAAVNPLPFKMCVFLYLAGYFLSQMH